MATVGIRYRLSTGKILGVYHVTNQSELNLNYDPTIEGMLTPSAGHAALTNQRDWTCPNGVLTHTPQPPAKVAPSILEFVEVLMEEVNALREKGGLSPLTMSEISDKAKGKM